MMSALRLLRVWCGLQLCEDLTLPQHTHTHTKDPIDCAHQASLSMGILQARIPKWVVMSSSRDLPNPGMKPGSPTLQADSLQSEPPGKPKNTGVGSLSLLQGIFPTQELNWGLLHCRWILYQLSYQGSPKLINSRKGK